MESEYSKMKKILLFLIPFILTGCTINYELNINEDLTVTENIKELTDESYFNKTGNVESTYKNIVDIGMQEAGYLRYDYLKENDRYGGITNKSYNSLEEFINTSLSYKEMYENLSIDKVDNIITIKSVGDLRIEKISFNEEGYPDVRIPEDVYFSVKLPFNVISHNADRVNKDYNIYYWDIDKSTTKDKSIEISFDTNTKHTSIKKILDKIDYTIVLIIGIILIIGYLIISIIKKNDENNRI